jgi:peptide-methionine (R)-S-oxide reductase
MNRRTLLQSLGALAALPLLPKIVAAAGTAAATTAGAIAPLRKSLAEWQALLPPASFNVLFREGTERAFTSPLNDEHRPGTFVCAACFLPLFASANKFDSGTGWPSFTQPIAGHIGKKVDYKLILPRTEYHCVRCGGHQGHVFDDGPAPRGERWCNNGVALNFIAQGKPLPALRT